jgi:hypothetical protein
MLMHVFMSGTFQAWNRIKAATMPGMAAQNAANSEPCATKKTMR